MSPPIQEPVSLTILGEPASKSNSRRLIYSRGRPRIIKSEKALQYLRDVKMQVAKRHPLLFGDLEFKAKIYYASRRPDLDISLILDALQGLVYVNDRQVKKHSIEWGLDHARPRAEIILIPLEKGWDKLIAGEPKVESHTATKRLRQKSQSSSPSRYV